jgi:ABC-type transport system substrate-binding protein
VASSLLDAAGYPVKGTDRLAPRLRFTCLIPEGFSVIERIGLEVQKNFYDIGVEIAFEAVPARDFDARIRSGQFEAILIDMISGPTIGRPYLFWRSAKDFVGLNLFGYENPQAERLFSLLAESTNEAAVRSATSRLQRVLLDDPPAVFIAWTMGSRAIGTQFKVLEEPGRDPLFSIWRWTSADASRGTLD